jgi:hypothetical protein
VIIEYDRENLLFISPLKNDIEVLAHHVEGITEQKENISLRKKQ